MVQEFLEVGLRWMNGKGRKSLLDEKRKPPALLPRAFNIVSARRTRCLSILSINQKLRPGYPLTGLDIDPAGVKFNRAMDPRPPQKLGIGAGGVRTLTRTFDRHRVYQSGPLNLHDPIEERFSGQVEGRAS